VPPAALALLDKIVGRPTAPKDAAHDAALESVPASRLIGYAGIETGAGVRLEHSRGQSLPDWIALRSGNIGAFPDGVAFPQSRDGVRSLLDMAKRNDWRVIPYGGGTSVAGHINPSTSARPVLTVDLSRLNLLQELDSESQLATFGAGVAGPDLEAALRAHGFTLGHFPQSFEYSTLGGWVATRSSGQQSLCYGRIERLFAGGHVETPSGTLDLKAFPASAAGPDLREFVLGSEGRMGIITEATVRVSRLAEREDFHGIFFPGFEQALAALREMLQARLPLSMLRLSTPEETRTTLLLAGHARLIRAMEGILALRGAGTGKCMLLAGLTGRDRLVSAARKELLSIARQHGAIHVGRGFGQAFKKNRFRAPYLRNDLWHRGYAVDTLETAVRWSRLPALLAAVETALRDGLSDENEAVHVFTHLSHPYLDGSSLYTTYLYRLSGDPEKDLARWRRLKRAASRAIGENSGTISHQHGVGIDHAPYLENEKGPEGMKFLASAIAHFDPGGLMNPGKLIAEEPRP
jgi:alkyldihydroxyacetonephosphate synthase